MLFFAGNKKFLNPILILWAGCFFAIASAEDSDEKATRSITGQPSVVIGLKTQGIAGLKTMVVRPVEHQPEFEAIGKITSIQPLLALRERYLVAQAELNGAKSRLKQARQNLERQQELFRNGIAAKRSLQEQEALGSADQAIVDASSARLMTIKNEAQLLWGRELAEWALSDKVTKFREILSGKQQLVQITLPTNKQLANQIDTIAIEPNGHRNKAIAGTLISRSTQIDNTMQGESYFFQAKAESFPIGMKVTAWIPETTIGQSGVVVPESALIWYMDQAYAYIKLGEDGFARRPVKKFSAAAKGFFIDEDIKPGEEVVITGAQMLLSQELRGQIPDED